MRIFSQTLLSLVLLAAFAPPALAQGDVDNARRHYEAGRSYYEQLRYAEAAHEFEEAYRLSGRAHLLKNVAVSHQHAESWDEAIAAFELYLEQAPDADDREEIESRIERLSELAASGAQEDPELATGDADRDLEAEELEGEEVSEDPDEGSSFPTATVVTLGAGVALGVGALITGIMSNGIYQDLESTCPMSSCLPAQEADKDRGQTLALTSTVLMGAAGAAAVVAVILFFTVDSSDEEAPPETASVSLAPGPGEVGASMRVAF